jgi:adenylate kinase
VTHRTADTQFHLVVMGKQGAGKGTQCALLAERLGLAHLATGDLLRAAVRDDTLLGRRVRRHLDAGALVPDPLIVAVVLDHLAGLPARGYVLDGFPRTVSQAEALLAAESIDAVVELDVSTDEALARLASRRVCATCGAVAVAPSPDVEAVRCSRGDGLAIRRTDDTETAIARRLAAYEAQTRPLTEWFRARGLLVPVDGGADADTVAARILTALLPQLERAS